MLAASPLAQPGILFDVVGPETFEQEAPPLGECRAAPGSTSRVLIRLRASLAVAAIGVAIGGLFAGLRGLHEIALESGARLPSQSWAVSWSFWLPIGLLGFAAARLLAPIRRLRDGLRLLAVLLVASVAVAQLALGALLPWVAGPVAGAVGIALGLSVSRLRQASPWLAAPCAGGAALLAVGISAASVAMVSSLTACLVLVVVNDEPAAMRISLRRWRFALTVLVAGIAATQLRALPSDQVHAAAAFTALVATSLVLRREGFAFGCAVATLGVAWWGGSLAAGEHARDEHVLATRPGAKAVYRRGDQELQLRLRDQVLQAVGPDRLELPLTIALAHGLVRAGDRVLLLGEVTGRAAASLQRDDRCVVESSPGFLGEQSLAEAVRGDGPVPLPVRPPLQWRGPRSLTQQRAGSRQLIVLGEFLGGGTAHRATVAFQRELRRVVGDGYLCQPVAMDRVSAALLDRWFKAASRAHRWNGLFSVGNAAVLVSGARPPVWLADVASGTPTAVDRWALHRAHLGGVADLREAMLGELSPSQRSGADRPIADVAGLLQRWLAFPPSAPCPVGDSVLRRWTRTRRLMQKGRERVSMLPDDVAGRAKARALAAQSLPIGAPAAWAQAALGLVGDDGVSLRDPRLASRCAHAIDPTFFDDPPAVFRSLPRPNAERGALEDLAELPPPARLAQQCVGDRPLAVALRARFASRCAQALLLRLADGPLAADGVQALRELADPFVLEQAAAVLLPIGRWRELLGLWRADLPMPTALPRVLHSDASGGARSALAVPERRELCAVLAGRRDPSCYALLAEFLLDEDASLRRIAAGQLFAKLGDAIPFDPEWPRSRRLDAAQRLRELHNRKP